MTKKELRFIVLADKPDNKLEHDRHVVKQRRVFNSRPDIDFSRTFMEEEHVLDEHESAGLGNC
jgi:hypothetical protein